MSQFGVITYDKIATEQKPSDIRTKWLPPIKFILPNRVLLGVAPH